MSSLDHLTRGPMPEEHGWRRAVERFGPYQSLILLAVPLCIVEPLKLAAVAVAGKGHWITGTGMIIAAYAASIYVVERLFLIVKPKLLELEWFAWCWTRFVTARDGIVSWFTGESKSNEQREDRR